MTAADRNRAVAPFPAMGLSQCKRGNMPVLIHREKQFHKCLLKLGRAGGRAAGAAEPDYADYDEIILKDLDGRLLRRIFRGLCGEE